MPQVKSINVSEARRLLKNCPKEVQEYVAALERSMDGQKRVTELAMQKIRELAKPKEQ